jgi:O-antigen/teichoic acid export membrane protein
MKHTEKAEKMPERTLHPARGTSIFLLQSLVSGVFRLGNIMVLTRLMFSQDLGRVAIMGMIYAFMQFLGAVGLNNASPLVVPQEERSGQLGRVRSFLKRSIAIILISSLSLVLLLHFVLPLFVTQLTLEPDLLWLVLVIGPFSSLEAFLDSFLLARYHVGPLVGGRIMFDVSRFAFTVMLVVNGFGAMGVAIGWFIGEIIAVLVFGSVAMSGLPKVSSPIVMRPVLVFALSSMLFQTVDVTIQNTDRVILLRFTGLTSLGVYDIILGMLFLISFISLSVSSAVYPVLTRTRVGLQGLPGWGRSMGRLISMLLRYIVMLLLPISAIASMNSHLVLSVVLGSAYADYPDASLSFSVLILSYVIWGVVYGIHAGLRSLGEVKFFAVVGFGIIFFEIASCWYLTSLLGLLGTAFVRAMYIALLCVTGLVRLRQRGIVGLASVGVSVCRIVAASVICGLLVYLAAPSSVPSFLFWMAIAMALYVLLLFLFGEITEHDFRIARYVLPSSLMPVVNRIQRVYHKGSSSSN